MAPMKADSALGRTLASLAVAAAMLLSFFAYQAFQNPNEVGDDAPRAPEARPQPTSANPDPEASSSSQDRPGPAVPAPGADASLKSPCPPPALETWLETQFTSFAVALPGFDAPRVRPMRFQVAQGQLRWSNADSFPGRARNFAEARLKKLANQLEWKFVTSDKVSADDAHDCDFSVEWQLVPEAVGRADDR